MNTGTFHDLINLWERCDLLRQALEDARKELTDEQWDELTDGPFGEILAAAVDVEEAFEDCK